MSAIDTEDLTRELWLPALAALPAEELSSAVEPLLAGYELEHQALPEDGLGLLSIRDGAWGETFYLGEFPVAAAHVLLCNAQGQEYQGAAQYMGDRVNKAVHMAVCDAVLAYDLPEKPAVLQLVNTGRELRKSEADRRMTILFRTRVDFDLLSTDHGGNDAY